MRPQSACNPRWVRIRSITADSRMAAMIFSSPPQFGQCSRSEISVEGGEGQGGAGSLMTTIRLRETAQSIGEEPERRGDERSEADDRKH